MSKKLKVRLAAAAAFIAAVAALATNVGNICDRVGLAFCINDVEQSASIGPMKLEQRVSHSEFVAAHTEGTSAQFNEDDQLGIRVLAQVTVKGYEGEAVTVRPTLAQSDSTRLRDLGVEPQTFVPRAPSASRTSDMWIQSPTQRGVYIVKVEILDESGTILAFIDSDPIEWPLPVPPVDVPTPLRPVRGPFEASYSSATDEKPRRIDATGYWARVSFRYLADPECESGGADFPCFLPLRTAPDFRDTVGRPITEKWPADGIDWVWIECQADGNGIENQGLLSNSQGTTSNRWNLINLGNGKNGVNRYAWGNDLWFLPKGPLSDEGGPKFPCADQEL